MKKLIKKAKQISILILALSLIGCTNDDVELPKVIAGFTYTLNIDTGTVTFINISESSRTYVWTFGDDTSSTEINPVKTYPNGTYTVTLKASNPAGSSDIFEDEITILIPEIATLPITFDGENTNYGAETFSGASFEIVDNPDLSGSNTIASKVAAITNIGAQFEGFYLDLGTPIDLSVDKTVKANFWSDTPIDVLLKLEEGTGGPIEAMASHGGSGWEEIYFTFDSAGSYSRFTMFVDGPGTTAGTFYLDDISQISTADIPCLETNLELPIDFDCNGIDYAAKIVGNVSFEVVDNPELSGINSDPSKVGKMTNVGENWENAFFNLDTAVDFSVDKGIKLKLFSDQALPIKLKLEDGTEAPVEADVDHGGTGWEELIFTFTSSASYNDMILFVDGPGTAVGIFYLDDIEQVAVAPPPPPCTETMLFLPIDFDCGGIDYESKRVPGDIGFSIIDNPQQNGVNPEATKVGEIVNIGNNWENLNFTLDTPISFATDKSIKLKLYSTVSVDIKLKVETGGTPDENDQTHGGTGWEELTFTLATSESFSNIIVFIDGPGNTVGTFYIDDIEQVTSGGGGGTSGAYLYSTAGTVDIITVWNDWDTGTVQDGEWDQDATYNPCIKLSGGSWGALVAFTEIPAGTLAEYGNLELKIKSDEATFKVKVPEDEKIFNIADGTPLADGWVQMSIPLSTFDAAAVDAAVQFAIWGSGGTTLYLTDIMLSGDGSGGGGGGGDCPAPPAGELLSNGNFEAGDVGCWQFFAGTSISTTVSNGGSNSAEMQGATGAAVGLKQERFAAGILLPNTQYTVSFDIIADGPFGEGGVFKAFTFSESAEGSDLGAIQHILADGVTSLSTSWETKTYTFTSSADANFVAGGLSFLIEIVNSSVKLNIDNVSITLN